jgi:hypothetical protein
MRNSVKLLIGLAMPGLALAVWLWTSRRKLQQESSHGNDTEMSLRSVAEEMKNITHRRCTNNGAAKILQCNDRCTENNCSEVKNNSEQDSSLSKDGSDKNTSMNTKLENLDIQNGMSLTQEELLENLTCAKNDGLLESSNVSNIESSEFSRDSQTGNPDQTVDSTEDYAGMSDRSNSYIKNVSFQESENTSGQNDQHTASPEASNLQFDQSKTMNTEGDTECSSSKGVNGITEVQSDVSASQKTENISKVDTKAPTARAQSLDESSDISSIDSKAESPVDQKLSSTTCSDSEPAQPEGGDAAEEITWELEFPQALCGRLIGKKGKNVQKISQITGTKIRLIPQKENTESSQRLVAVTGSSKQLKLALKALREKFPSVPFTRLNGTEPILGANHSSPTPNIVCVALPENELCQVFVTNIVDANHFYVQLCDHSIHNHLRQLDQEMYQYYSSVGATMVPQTINTGMLCAAPSPTGCWWRAQVVGLLMKPDEVEITWLDYGGRTTVPTAMLRQLRYVNKWLQCRKYSSVSCRGLCLNYLKNISQT